MRVPRAASGYTFGSGTRIYTYQRRASDRNGRWESAVNWRIHVCRRADTHELRLDKRAMDETLEPTSPSSRWARIDRRVA